MIIDQDKCVQCGACIAECTMDAIQWQPGNTLLITNKCSDCYCPASDACPTEAIGENLTATEFKEKSNFQGWDFQSVWEWNNE